MATCTASLLRGTETNGFGDEVDSDTAVATGFFAAIREVRSLAMDPNSGMPRTIRTMQGNVPSNVDVHEGDRLRDDTNGVLYTIENVTRSTGAGFTRDTVLELQRVT